MLILSIDVGIRNLAMCVVDGESREIVRWDVGGIPPQHGSGLFPCFRDYLDDRPWVLDVGTILIEKQPGMNKTMKTVENFLHAYFVIKLPEVETIIYDARHKVPDVVGTGKANYRRRKNTAIERCRDIVRGGDWDDFFNRSTKKDDLADTLLQALSFLNRVEKPPTRKINDVPRPRKPTTHQASTKYSKANLAWIVKNTPNPTEDRRFMKDVLRYYKSYEELLKTMNTQTS